MVLCHRVFPPRSSRTACLAVAIAALAASAMTVACKRSQAAPLADVTAGHHGFVPSSLKLRSGGAGSHTSVSFVRTTDDTCATEVVFPDLKIEKRLPLNEVVSVDVPTDGDKTLVFQCGMAMYKGSIVVTQK